MSRLKCGRSGLSLLELVVVLGILAILAGITIQSLEPMADQARYDATVRTLEAIEDAIYQEQTLDGDRVAIRGFIADMGRLPVTVDELWQPFQAGDPTNPMPVYSRRPIPLPEDYITSIGVENVPQLASGWNGPYLQPPRNSNGTSTLQDGWGRPFQMLPTPADNREIRSLGSDGVVNESAVAQTTFSQDIRCSRIYGQYPEQGLLAHTGNKIEIRVSVATVTLSNVPSLMLELSLFGSEDGLATKVFPTESTLGQTITPDGTTQEITFGASNLTVGPKLVFLAIVDQNTLSLYNNTWTSTPVSILPGHNPSLQVSIAMR